MFLESNTMRRRSPSNHDESSQETWNLPTLLSWTFQPMQHECRWLDHPAHDHRFYESIGVKILVSLQKREALASGVFFSPQIFDADFTATQAYSKSLLIVQSMLPNDIKFPSGMLDQHADS